MNIQVHNLRDWLNEVDELTRQVRGIPEGFLYGSYEGLVADLGKTWMRGEVQTFGPLKQCYHNSWLAAERNDWEYVEGYAMSEIMPVMHAWCVDDNGHVVETTWETVGSEYRGIGMDVKTARSVIGETGVWGIMPNDYLNSYKLLKDGSL